jgi:hypothetical protein
MNAPRQLRRWPLFLIAAPAAVAIWSGWVGLGGLCGFGLVHPLPGIVPGLQLNTAITLPVGVEAYGAYALGAWLTPAAVPASARTFARRSAIGALVLGMCGQVIYHLLAAAHAARAPWPVVVLVSCMPVITLGFGAALTHLIRTDHSGTDAGPAQQLEPGTLPVREDLAPADGPAGEVRTDMPAVEVDRDAVVAELAEEMRAAVDAGERWRPDYEALMARTGFRRSWCEKAVRDARMAALDPPRTGDDQLVLAGANGHAP